MDINNSRFFDVSAAAIALMALTTIVAIDRELAESNIVPAKGTDEVDRTVAYLKTQGIGTQGHFAAIVINFTHGEDKIITPDDLTTAVAVAFPNANVQKRHGPHYLSHARHGRLKGLREDLKPIPHARRKAKAKVVEDLDIANDAPAITVDLLMEENDRPTLMAMAEGLEIELKKNWSTKKVAQSIVEKMAA